MPQHRGVLHNDTWRVLSQEQLRDHRFPPKIAKKPTEVGSQLIELLVRQLGEASSGLRQRPAAVFKLRFRKEPDCRSCSETRGGQGVALECLSQALPRPVAFAFYSSLSLLIGAFIASVAGGAFHRAESMTVFPNSRGTWELSEASKRLLRRLAVSGCASTDRGGAHLRPGERPVEYSAIADAP
jgi:hypothetical protein